MTTITNVLNCGMSKNEVLQLMTGVVNIKHFTKFYINGDSYDVKIDRHDHGVWHRDEFTHENFIYINNILVYQQFPNNCICTLDRNIQAIRKILCGKTDDEKRLTHQDNAVPYINREWSIVSGIPIVIESTFEDGWLFTSVYYRIRNSDNDAEERELGDNLLLEMEEPCANEAEAKERAEGIECVLYKCYYLDLKSKMLVNCEDENEDEDEAPKFTETIIYESLLYYIVDDKLYDVVTEGFIKMMEKPIDEKYERWLRSQSTVDSQPQISNEIPHCATIIVKEETEIPHCAILDDEKTEISHCAILDDEKKEIQENDNLDMIEVKKIVLNGITYLKCDDGAIYDSESEEFIGFLDHNTNTIICSGSAIYDIETNQWVDKRKNENKAETEKLSKILEKYNNIIDDKLRQMILDEYSA